MILYVGKASMILYVNKHANLGNNQSMLAFDWTKDAAEQVIRQFGNGWNINTCSRKEEPLSNKCWLSSVQMAAASEVALQTLAAT